MIMQAGSSTVHAHACYAARAAHTASHQLAYCPCGGSVQFVVVYLVAFFHAYLKVPLIVKPGRDRLFLQAATGQ